MEIILIGSTFGSSGEKAVAGDGLSAQWSKIRPHVRTWWAELPEEEIDELNGSREHLLRLIQRVYGRSREDAEQEVNRFLIRVERLIQGAHGGTPG